jgi:hypothetical protein
MNSLRRADLDALFPGLLDLAISQGKNSGNASPRRTSAPRRG